MLNYDGYQETYANLKPQIDAGIEKYRKADIEIEVVGNDGKPVPDAKLRLRQENHAFDFGCNALKLGHLGIDTERYEQALSRLFNLVTTTFCLADIEPVPGEWRFAEGSREIFRRPPPDRVRNFAEKHGIALKGQPLLAGSWFPKWAADYSHDEICALYSDYFRRVAERYGKSFKIFDIVNEAFLHKNFPLYSENCEYVDWAFREASKYFVNTDLELNESTFVNYGQAAERYYSLAKRLIDTKTGIKSIGFQFHMFTGQSLMKHIGGEYLKLNEIFDTYNKFSGLEVPLYISEVTIPSKLDGYSKAEGEAVQADIIEMLYSLWFSIPEMAGIIYWNLCDGVNWRNEGDCLGCLCDENIYEKPAYNRLYQLINRKWKTCETLTTDINGTAVLRGFKGAYTGEVSYNGKKAQLAFDLKNVSEKVKVSLI